jgi:hypothetical protein
LYFISTRVILQNVTKINKFAQKNIEKKFQILLPKFKFVQILSHHRSSLNGSSKTNTDIWKEVEESKKKTFKFRHDTQHYNIRNINTQHYNIQNINTQRYNIQHNDTQLNDTQYNVTQYNNTQYNDTQYNDIQQNNK